jgi:hypothetical protein
MSHLVRAWAVTLNCTITDPLVRYKAFDVLPFDNVIVTVPNLGAAR